LTSSQGTTVCTSLADEDYRTEVFSTFKSTVQRCPQDGNLESASGSLLPGLVLGLGLDQHHHDVALFHDEVLNTVDFDLGARPFAEQDAVTDLDVDRDKFAALVAAAGPTAMILPCWGFS
jgi:hypothetical protein